MSRTADYEAKTEALLRPIAAKNNVTIYDVEYIKEGSDYILRAYIDKEAGVSINDCEAVSRALSDALDENDFIAEAYVLEVSSPGLGRQLKKDKHLLNSMGEAVAIKTYQPVESGGMDVSGCADEKENKKTKTGKSKKPQGNKGIKDFTGILKFFDNEKIIIENNGAETAFNRIDIASIRLKFDFE